MTVACLSVQGRIHAWFQNSGIGDNNTVSYPGICEISVLRLVLVVATMVLYPEFFNPDGNRDYVISDTLSVVQRPAACQLTRPGP
jgi:hypothetical protein